MKDRLTEYEGVVGILLSKVEVSQIICESIYARPRRASLLSRVSMNEINLSTTQKCEMIHALTEYEGVVGILLSKVEITQRICESICVCPRRASALARVSMNEINSSTTQKCEMRHALTGYEGVVGILLSKVEITQRICESICACSQRASALARVSMNKINSSTTQKCEMRHALTEYEGVVGILLSKVEIT